MAVPWHKYASKYKTQRIEDTATYTLFEAADRVKIHTIAVFYNEVGKVGPSTMTITITDADSTVLQVQHVSSLFSVSAIPIPVMIDNGLKVSVTTTSQIALDLFITYTPAGS